MRRRVCAIFISITLACVLLGFALPAPRLAFSAQSSPPEAKFDAALLTALSEPGIEQDLRFILHMADTAVSNFTNLPADELPRRTAVVAQLQANAADSQSALRQELSHLQATGKIAAYRPFWIINAVAVQGDARALQTLAARDDVARVSLDAAHRYFDPESYTAVHNFTPPAAGQSTWGTERVRAPHAWAGLGIDGAGVTVAIVDTGVDWEHPLLRANYRGLRPDGSVDHAGSWFNTVVPTSTIPSDRHGHGTHVAGTAVGSGGIGVAPGAQWIAVAIADEYGIIYDSNVHAGFEWLLAPAGDPALAPDVVNNSWSGAGARTAYQEDLRALHAAGIVTVFAAGNTGPRRGSVGSPASYPETIAVGASDERDAVAWFSSRGPSPLTTEATPLLLAPGTQTVSARVGGGTHALNGTSMATPHVSGAIALLLEANPALTLPDVRRILAETAVPLTTSLPSPDTGYGRLDAYAAVASATVGHGTLRGQLLADGLPAANVPVTLTTSDGAHLRFVTDADGTFRAALQPGSYALEATPFGFAARRVPGIVVRAGQTTRVDLPLARLLSGTLGGQVRAAESGQPLAARVRVAGTPLAVETGVDGRFQVSLPQGAYDVIVEATGRRTAGWTVSVTPGGMHARDVALAAGPSILLVDSGQWRYRSAQNYFRAALTAGGYGFDLWEVHDPTRDVPGVSDLTPYDIVVWSAPDDSPGLLQASDVITDYLGAGGWLLISGQNVASRDGQTGTLETWWQRDVSAVFLGERQDADHTQISGAPGTPFAGLTFTLNGGSGANNQQTPDETKPREGTLTRAAFSYADGHAAGMLAGYCRQFRVLYLGFGLEGVAQADARTSVLARGLEALQAARTVSGVEWVGGAALADVALAGTEQVYTLTLRNLSETITDTFRLSVAGDGWKTELMTETLELRPCEMAQTVLRVQAPPEMPDELVHDLRVTAVSTTDSSAQASYTLHYRMPADVLLVDDDRFYDREAAYTTALDGLGVDYDVWDTDARGSPSAALLRAYPYVLWFTGYDWFAPITPGENAALTEYVAGNGRLFLSSQDFLYRHGRSALARDHFGILDFQEAVTPTLALGAPALAMPGPLPLEFGEYRNYADGMLAGPETQPLLWHERGLGGVARPSPGGGRAVFWSVPFEALPLRAQLPALRGVMGWLSDLGDSTLAVDVVRASGGEPRVFTLTLRSVSATPQSVSITNALPAGLELLPSTVRGDAAYDAQRRVLTWQGTLGPGAVHEIRYKAVPLLGLGPGTRLENRVTIDAPGQGVAFERSAPLWVDSPDLSGSELTAIVSEPTARVQWLTYTLVVRNDGLAGTRGATAVLGLPRALHPLTDTLRSSAGQAALDGERVTWLGDVAPGDVVSVSLVLTRELSLLRPWVAATAVLQDGVTNPVVGERILYLPPYRALAPVVAGGVPLTPGQNVAKPPLPRSGRASASPGR